MSADKDANAANKSRDELLKDVPEADIILTLKQTLARSKRWFELKDRPIPATDLGCYQRAFDEILKLEQWPDEEPGTGNKSVN